MSYKYDEIKYNPECLACKRHVWGHHESRRLSQKLLKEDKS
jgi:hypothetical protein